MLLSDDYYKKVLDNLYDGIYLLDENRNIIYWNAGAEKHTGFHRSEVINKCCDNVLQHVDGEGVPLCGDGCPVSQTIQDGRLREVEVYVRHKEGHRVPVSMRIAPIKGTDNQVAVAVEIYNDNSPKYTLHRMVEELKTQALLDPMLELGNRRYLESNIRGRLEELGRYGWQFGVLFVDIDHFKDINDRYGHETGDKVLRMVSKSMSNSLRTFDMVGRWGGEEFVVIVVNVQQEQLYAVANRLRMLVEQSSVMIGPETVRATVSIGAAIAMPADDVTTLIKRADQLMYKSKDSGRNCITIGV
jgi:diguanylate cyclase (GGDEF)-like protein/PAS domain S-box-containing protein